MKLVRLQEELKNKNQVKTDKIQSGPILLEAKYVYKKISDFLLITTLK